MSRQIFLALCSESQMFTFVCSNLGSNVRILPYLPFGFARSCFNGTIQQERKDTENTLRRRDSCRDSYSLVIHLSKHCLKHCLIDTFQQTVHCVRYSK